MSIDPNVKNWNVNYANDPAPPDFKQLLDAKAAEDQLLANLPSSHPSYAAHQTRQAALVQQIANHPKRAAAPLDK